MARLHYAMICSLDGYAADESGDFSWSQPDPEVHQHANDFERTIGTNLYGRLMYEVMSFWETPEARGDENDVVRDYADAWQEADKIVFSSTLDAVTTARTTLVRAFDPEYVRQLKDSADRPLSIGGPTLAAEALRAGLVDDIHLYVVPWIIGGGLAVLPDGLRTQLELRDEHRFESGVVYLHYALRR